jgi:hypothetical protein
MCEGDASFPQKLLLKIGISNKQCKQHSHYTRLALSLLSFTPPPPPTPIPPISKLITPLLDELGSKADTRAVERLPCLHQEKFRDIPNLGRRSVEI